MRVFVLFLFCTLLACSNKKSSPEVQALYDQVMEVHDDVMPETSTIHKLKKNLRKSYSGDSLAMVLIANLDAADESMMSWMSEFGEYKKIKSDEDHVRLDYLNNELIRISDVRDEMLSAIAEARKFIESHDAD